MCSVLQSNTCVAPKKKSLYVNTIAWNFKGFIYLSFPGENGSKVLP